MEEIEVPIEESQEHIHHAAQHANVRWITYVALSSAILAVLAAVSALMSGHHANEAMILQIQSSDKWNYYQAKSIKATVLDSRIQMIEQLNKKPPGKDLEKLAEYKTQQEEIAKEADKLQKESEAHLNLHNILARAVTMFQVAIAIGAIAALTRRKYFWYVSLCFGVFGCGFLLQNFLQH